MPVPTSQELSDAIATAKLNAVQNPLREEAGGRVIQERSADDLLKIESSASPGIDKPGFGIRMTKLVPPGCG